MPPQDVAEKAPAHGRRQPVAMVPPAVPLTLDGSSLLHQMFRVRWPHGASSSTGSASGSSKRPRRRSPPWKSHPDGGSALFSQLGHKGDLLVIHFRRSFDALNEAELQLAHLDLDEYLEPTHSYVSVVELGLYESSVQLYDSLARKRHRAGQSRNGSRPSRKKSTSRRKRWPRGCGPKSRRTAICASIRWIKNAAR